MELPRQHNERKTMRNTICAALTTITLASCVALAGCGSASNASPALAATGATCSESSDDGIKECIVTLSGTRQVDCVVFAWTQHGGLSCDWSHVSGADKEPQ